MKEKTVTYYRDSGNIRYNIKASRTLTKIECEIIIEKYHKDNPKFEPESGYDYDIESKL